MSADVVRSETEFVLANGSGSNGSFEQDIHYSACKLFQFASFKISANGSFVVGTRITSDSLDDSGPNTDKAEQGITRFMLSDLFESVSILLVNKSDGNSICKSQQIVRMGKTSMVTTKGDTFQNEEFRLLLFALWNIEIFAGAHGIEKGAGG
eukprot:scaffold277866_cov51-Attheya_sp.AAC.2